MNTKNSLVLFLIFFVCSSVTLAQSNNVTKATQSKVQIEVDEREALMRSMYEEVHGITLDDKGYLSTIATSPTNLIKWEKVLEVQEKKGKVTSSDLKYLREVIAGMTAKTAG